MWQALGGNKSKRTIDYLGIDAPGYHEYMESTFQPGMTWANQGKGPGCWNIGHRTPLKYNDPTVAEIEQRLYFLNTFAQWETDNDRQGNQYIFEEY